MCGECIRGGYGPSVYSFKYTFNCSDCSKMSVYAATALYLTLELVPVTILFFVIMIFRINIIAGPLLGYIIFCQLQLETAHLQLPLLSLGLTHLGTLAKIFYYLLFSVAGIWSLDFLKVSNAVPLFCISEKITDMKALWFDYLQVVYTLFLVVITYTCIELHSQNCRLIVFFWKPFLRPCIRIRRKWSVNGSLIHAYATFLNLMFVQLNVVFVDLHREIILYGPTGFERSTHDQSRNPPK